MAYRCVLYVLSARGGTKACLLKSAACRGVPARRRFTYHQTKKGNRMSKNLLEQLKEMTVVVADAEDIQAIETFTRAMPRQTRR